MHIVGTWVQMYILSYASVHMYTGIWVHSSRFSSRSARSCCSHFYCITSLNLNRAEPSFGSHGCSPGSHWHLAALRGWLSATRKHSQTKKNSHTHAHAHRQSKSHMQLTVPPQLQRTFRTSLALALSLSLTLSSPRRHVRLNENDDSDCDAANADVDDSGSDSDGRLPVSLSFSAVLGIESATSEQRTTFQSQTAEAANSSSLNRSSRSSSRVQHGEKSV